MIQENDTLQREITAKQPLLKPASWLAQLDFINHLLQFNNVMLVAFADKKGGKTSYIQFLQEHLAESFDIYVAKSATPYNDKDITCGLASHLNLAKPYQATMADICQQVNERNHHTLLILDDAQCISEQQVDSYLEIIKAQGISPFFHMLLVADFSFLPYLKQLSDIDTDDFIHSMEIGSFAQDEIKTFLHQKLADKRLRDLLTNNHCERFYKFTNGQIAAMNHEMNSFFSSLANANRKLFIRLTKVSAIAAMVVVGFALMHIWQRPARLPSSTSLAKLKRVSASKQQFVKKASPLNSTISSIAPNLLLTSHISKFELPSDDSYIESQLAAITVNTFHTKKTAIATDKMVSKSPAITPFDDPYLESLLVNINSKAIYLANNNTDASSISQMSNKPLSFVDAYVDPHVAAVDSEGFHPQTKKTSKSKAKLAKATISQQKISNNKTRDGNANLAKKDKIKLVVKAGVTQAPSFSDVTKTVENNLNHIQFAKEQPKQADLPPKYTIQLVATHKIRLLKVLMARYPVTALKMYTFPLKQNGEQWYILTAGQFANWSEAHDALAKLPPQYQQFKPWIRPIDKG